jgi:hypothetical protein
MTCRVDRSNKRAASPVSRAFTRLGMIDMSRPHNARGCCPHTISLFAGILRPVHYRCHRVTNGEPNDGQYEFPNPA